MDQTGHRSVQMVWRYSGWEFASGEIGGEVGIVVAWNTTPPTIFSHKMNTAGRR